MAQYVYTMNRVGKVVPPKREILKDISLSFFPGAKIGVLGLNGAGKSTLLKIMAGLDSDIQGEARPMPDIKVGYLPQEPRLDPSKNVFENIVEGIGEPWKLVQRFEEVSRILEEHAYDPPPELGNSGGGGGVNGFVVVAVGASWCQSCHTRVTHTDALVCCCQCLGVRCLPVACRR